MRDISRPVVCVREERGRLAEDVAEQHVAQIADDALPDVGHQIPREIRADALDEVDDEDRDDRRDQALARRAALVEDRLDQRGEHADAAPYSTIAASAPASRARCGRAYSRRRKSAFTGHGRSWIATSQVRSDGRPIAHGMIPESARMRAVPAPGVAHDGVEIGALRRPAQLLRGSAAPTRTARPDRRDAAAPSAASPALPGHPLDRRDHVLAPTRAARCRRCRWPTPRPAPAAPAPGRAHRPGRST